MVNSAKDFVKFCVKDFAKHSTTDNFPLKSFFPRCCTSNTESRNCYNRKRNFVYNWCHGDLKSICALDSLHLRCCLQAQDGVNNKCINTAAAGPQGKKYTTGVKITVFDTPRVSKSQFTIHHERCKIKIMLLMMVKKMNCKLRQLIISEIS